MCGIVGYVGNKQVVPVIIDGLRKLEYRGYDSAGIAVVDEGHHLDIRRAEGKLRNLEEAIRLKPLDGTYGIGHTRWATHGRPTEENAHPHRDCTGRVVVVHNGIIENYLQLKDRLRRTDHRFVTETDTEVVAHLIEEHMKHEESFEQAVRRLRCATCAASSRSRSSRPTSRTRSSPSGKGRPSSSVSATASTSSPRTFRPSCNTRATCSSSATARSHVLTQRRRARHGLRGQRRRAARSSASLGTRSWRRRAASSTSCSRRFTSSRAPSATPCRGASLWIRAASISTR